MTNGVCDDCKHEIQMGEWPFDCAGRGHILYIRLAILGRGRTKEYDPPMPLSPIKGPQITRDWLNPDGTTRPMASDEYNKNFVGVDA
jgi:hypothetical protein